MSNEPIDQKSFLDKFDDFLETYQKHSGKISVCLSVLGGIASILVGYTILGGSIAIGITNASLFFSGLMTEQIVNKKKIVEKDNESLKAELTRRMTLMDNFKFPLNSPSTDSLNTPSSNASTKYEEVVEIVFPKQ